MKKPDYTLDELEAVEHEVVDIAKKELDLFIEQTTDERIAESATDRMKLLQDFTRKKSIATSFNLAKAIVGYVAEKRARGPHSKTPLPEDEIKQAMEKVDAARSRLRLVK